MRPHLPAAFELALHRSVLVDKQHHDVNRGLAEMDAERRRRKLAPQRLHAVDEQFQAFDLHLRARKAVEDAAVAIFRLQEAAEENAHDLTIADHVTGVLDAPGLR